jgi:hypothetical protein
MQCHQVCTAHSPVRGWGHEAGMGAQKVGEPQIFKALLTVMWICGITGFRLSNNTPRGCENKITNIIAPTDSYIIPWTIEKDRCYSEAYNQVKPKENLLFQSPKPRGCRLWPGALSKTRHGIPARTSARPNVLPATPAPMIITRGTIPKKKPQSLLPPSTKKKMTKLFLFFFK